jgi:hypothetical protein
LHRRTNPEDKTEKELEKHVAPAIRHHMQNFLASIDARSRPVSDIEQGYISTASCILANNSMKLGRSLAWDPERQLVVGDSEANALLRQVSSAVHAPRSLGETCNRCLWLAHSTLSNLRLTFSEARSLARVPCEAMRVDGFGNSMNNRRVGKLMPVDL